MEAKVITTPDALRVLQDEGKMTFATIVDGYEVHHQLDISEYDTRDKIEARMAEVLTQVAAELKGRQTHTIPDDIQKFVDSFKGA